MRLAQRYPPIAHEGEAKTGCYVGRSAQCINGMDFRISVILEEDVGGHHSQSLIYHLLLPVISTETSVRGKVQ